MGLVLLFQAHIPDMKDIIISLILVHTGNTKAKIYIKMVLSFAKTAGMEY